jgi:nitrogenase molybdenum-iron protein beta chain
MSDFIERAKFSCALGGAIATLTSIPRAVPIIHAAGGCAAYLSGTFNIAAGYRGVGYCGGNMLPTTNIAENNIVFGGEERLAEQIENTLRVMDGDLYFVLTGCQVEIIGDDSVAVARRFRDRNVVAASTPGFAGNSLKGCDLVLSSLAQNFIPVTTEREALTVNILGVVPGQDVFYRGNLDGIANLLSLIGVHANTFFGSGESVDKIRTYGKAALSVVLSPNAGLIPAKTFEKNHGIPYIKSELPIGPTGSAAFLRQVGSALGVSSNIIETAILKEQANYYSFLERISDIYADVDFQRYVLIATDSYYAHPLTRFLANDFGWIPVVTAVNDLEEDSDKAAYTALFDDIAGKTTPKIVYETNAGQLLNIVREAWGYNRNQKYFDALSPSFVIGSTIERTLAEKLGAGFLAVAFPVSNRAVLNRGYTGYYGAVSLVEDLITNLVAGR